MPGSISTTYITIRPDTRGFRTETDAELRKALADAGVQVKVGADTATASAAAARLKAQLADLSKRINVGIDVGDKQAQAKLLALQARLIDIGKRSVSPNIDLAGVARAQADLAALDVALDKVGATDETAKVRVDTSDAERGVSRLIDSLLAIGPVMIPVGAALAGGFAGLAGAFTAAGVGVGAFALAAAPALKKITDAEGALNTAVQSRTAAQKKALDGLSTSESNAAKEMLSLAQTYAGFSRVLEPTTFTALSKGADIAKTGLHDIAPIAHATGLALIGLEGDLKKALDTQYVRTFFNYLGVEAPRSVGTLGRSVGNVGLGFAGILQAFTPVEHQLEGGLESLSKRFADFGKGAGTNSGLQSFIDYIQTEGPKVIHLIGQFGSTFADVARDAAPLGAAELKIVSGLLGFVDAEAKAHPKLIELALGVYTVNKAIGALKIGALLTGVGGAVGTASSGKGLLGLGAGLVGLSTGSKKLADVFPKVAKAASGVGTASVGAQLGLLGVGEAVGGGVAAGVGLVSGLGLLVGGLIAVQAHFSAGKQSADQYAASIAKVAGVSAPSGTNNARNLANYTSAINAEGNAASRQTPERNAALLTAGNASDPTGANFARQARNVDALTQAQKLLSQQQKATISGDKSMQSSLKSLGPDFDLTGKATAQLADKLGINLAVGFKTSAKMSDAQKVAVSDNVSKLKEYKAEIEQSHDPTAKFAADIKQAGDATQTAAQQQQAFNNALGDYQSLTTGVATSSAQAGDALAAMAKDFSKGTSAAQKNGAAQKILSGNLLEAGPQTRKLAEDLSGLQSSYDGNLEAMFKNATESGHTAQGFAQVTKQADLNRAALIKQLEALGLNATEAKKLADKYAAIPKDITSKAVFNTKTAEAAAKTVKKDFLDIPTTHKTTAIAAVTTAEKDMAAWKTQIQHLPKSARTKAELLYSQAETDLANLEQHIWDLTHKKWSVTINADGNIDIPNIRNGGGPVQAPAMARGGTIPPNGMAWVGERGPELIQVQSAARVYPHTQSMQIAAGMAPIPGFAAGGVINMTAKTNAASLIPSVTGLMGDLAAAQKYAASLVVHYNAGAGVAQWAPLILKALAANGQPASLLGTVERRMNQESGGNPKAINLTDINALNGDPSRGLMQDIMATFRAHHAPGTSSNIYDPFANIMASMRYAISRYGSLPAAYNRAGGYANGGNASTGEMAWVGEQGPELVRFHGPATVYKHSDSMKMAGAGLPGYATGGKVTPNIAGTTFKSSKLFEQAGSHLLDVILGSLGGSRAASTIKSVTDNLIRSIDTDFTGSAKSGLVQYTQRVNTQMIGLAKQRDSIAAKISAADTVASGLTTAARSFTDITALGGTAGAGQIASALGSKLSYIKTFGANLTKLSKLGYSKALISQIIAAGPDTGGPLAQQLAAATPSQVRSINATESAIGRSSTALGTLGVNAQFGGNAARGFVGGLQAQEDNLEKQMNHLAGVFAKGVGKAFHIKGYAGGGTVGPGEVAIAGERGPEIITGPGRVYPAAQSAVMRGSQIDYDRLGAAIAKATGARTAPVIGTVHVQDNTDLELTIRKAAFAMQSAGLL